MISDDVIGGVCDPDTGRGKVCLEHAFTSSGRDNQIILDKVISFNSVFQKYIVSYTFISHIVNNSQIVGGVNSNYSGIRVVN
jgi:hypothetical protein